MRRQAGFGLVEILIAMTLGLVLGAAIINVYLESRRSYSQDEELARLQEGGRYALNIIKRELSMAGFVGGLVDKTKLTSAAASGGDCVASGNWALDVSTTFDMVNDFDDSSTSVTTRRGKVLDSCLTASQIQGDADIIAVKRTAGGYTLEDGVLVAPGAVDKQYYLRVKDRSEYDWVHVGSGGAISDTGTSGYDYWAYYANILFIREYASTAGDDIPTLFMESLSNDSMGPAVALVEGVENLQLEVGIDNNGDGVPELFRAPASVADLDDAIAWRVYVLMRSVNTITGYTNTKTFNLGQKTVGPMNDGYLRQVFTTTIQSPNSNLGF